MLDCFIYLPPASRFNHKLEFVLFRFHCWHIAIVLSFRLKFILSITAYLNSVVFNNGCHGNRFQNSVFYSSQVFDGKRVIISTVMLSESRM